MKIVNMYEAKTNLSKLAEQVLAGEKIVLAKNGHPIIDLMIHKPSKSTKRQLGVWADQPLGYDDQQLIATDAEIAASFRDSINRPLPT